MRPDMGMASLRKRCAATGLTTSSAAIPLCEIARLMERFWEATLEEGRRKSGRDSIEWQKFGSERQPDLSGFRRLSHSSHAWPAKRQLSTLQAQPR